MQENIINICRCSGCFYFGLIGSFLDTQHRCCAHASKGLFFFFGKPHRINIKLLLLYLVQCLLHLTQQTSRHPKITFIWIPHPALTTKHFKGCPWIRMGSLHYIGNESAPCFQADAADWSHFSKCAVRMERNTKTWSERLNEGERDKFQRRVWGASGSHAERL